MRWLFNGILVVAGLPLVGTSLLLICSFDVRMRDDFSGAERFAAFGLWLFFLSLFAAAYMARTRWLQRRGIYRSWSDFEAYMKENHRHPSVSEKEETDFLSWAGLPEERPAEFRKAMRALYDRIQAEVDSEEQRESYIKCLAWYASPWPVHEICYEVRRDCYGEDEDDGEDWPAGNA
jgi:hypothetical protein